MVTILFPAHPSYFEEGYSQDEIDQALRFFDLVRRLPMTYFTFELVRSPGLTTGFVVSDNREWPAELKLTTADKVAILENDRQEAAWFYERAMAWVRENIQRGRQCTN